MHSFSYFPLFHTSTVCPGEGMFGPPSARLYDTAAVEAWASASTNAAVYVFPSSFKHKKFFGQLFDLFCFRRPAHPFVFS